MDNKTELWNNACMYKDNSFGSREYFDSVFFLKIQQTDRMTRLQGVDASNWLSSAKFKERGHVWPFLSSIRRTYKQNDHTRVKILSITYIKDQLAVTDNRHDSFLFKNTTAQHSFTNLCLKVCNDYIHWVSFHSRIILLLLAPFILLPYL